MSASQEAETSPARGHSPRFRWFVLSCVVLYYTLYGVGTFLVPSERSTRKSPLPELLESTLVAPFDERTLSFPAFALPVQGPQPPGRLP